MIGLGLLLLAAPPLQVVDGDARTPLAAEVSEASLTVLEPLSRAERTFTGRSAIALLDAAFGAAWRDRAEVVFHCADGYAARVETKAILRYRPLLAHAVDAPAFSVVNREGKAVALAPYYLVWDSLTHPEIQAWGAKGWPYQVVGLASVGAGEGLEALQPPEGAPAAARRGLAAFQKYCVACHAVNGAGGKVGPELNYPMSVTEYVRPRWLKVWLLDPRRIRAGTPMPGLPPGIDDREGVADDVLAYLRSMRARKIAP